MGVPAPIQAPATPDQRRETRRHTKYPRSKSIHQPVVLHSTLFCNQAAKESYSGGAAPLLYARLRQRRRSNTIQISFLPGGVDPGDDGSVALEQRLQGGPASPALPGGAAPGL